MTYLDYENYVDFFNDPPTAEKTSEHIAMLFRFMCRKHRDCAWKTKQHPDGSMREGMFLVAIHTNWGDVGYYFPIDPYWVLFDVQEAKFSRQVDSKMSDDAPMRLRNFMNWEDYKGNNHRNLTVAINPDGKVITREQPWYPDVD